MLTPLVLKNLEIEILKYIVSHQIEAYALLTYLENILTLCDIDGCHKSRIVA